jgi:serine/threonine-protein kinase
MTVPSDANRTPGWQDWEALERVVEDFEQAWQRGDSPVLPDYLPAEGPGRQELLVELIHTDLEFRLKAAMPVRAEGYLARYPELGQDRKATLDLIVAEYEIRRRREPGLAAEGYLQRFPPYAAELASRLVASSNFPGGISARAPGSSLQGLVELPAAPVATAAELAHLLEKFRLLPPGQNGALSRLRQSRAEPRALARELLERGWLTPFQVNRLFQGRARELVLGPYVFLERLGSGGMGQVFKARHEDIDLLLAVKLLRKDLIKHPLAVRLFRREIRANIQLAHPNVVLALDTGQIDGVPFFAMEYVEGIDLARLVHHNGPLPVEAACDYARQAALGLQHAHERGLVHRDVKPNNLMLRREDGVIKLLDLGLARLILPLGGAEASSTLYRDTSMVGTPDFMAPEQTVNASAADIRSDNYSLGCTLYYLLTGQVPFPGKTLGEKLLMQQTREPRPVDQLRPDVPTAVVAVLTRMMAKAPGARFQTPAEAARALASCAGPP